MVVWSPCYGAPIEALTQHLVGKLQTHLVTDKGQHQRKKNRHHLIRVGREGRHRKRSIHMSYLCGPSREAFQLRTHPAHPAKAQSDEAI